MKRNGGGVAAMIAGLHSAKMTLKNVNVNGIMLMP